MMYARVTFAHAEELRRVLNDEMTKGVTLLQIAAPEALEYRSAVRVEFASPGGSFSIDSEVVHVLPSVGVAVSFPSAHLAEARALLASTPEGPAGPTFCEIVPAGGALFANTVSANTVSGNAAPANTVSASTASANTASASTASVNTMFGPAPSAVPAPGDSRGFTSAGGLGWSRASFAEKVQTALHGTKDDRAAILREQNKQLHPFVLKSPHVSPEEVAGWAANAQMSPEFLKQIAERKEWMTRQAIALALARNPKTPAEVAVRALDNVPVEALRQMAKGVGVLPHVVAAARKKILPK